MMRTETIWNDIYAKGILAHSSFASVGQSRLTGLILEQPARRDWTGPRSLILGSLPTCAELPLRCSGFDLMTIKE